MPGCAGFATDMLRIIQRPLACQEYASLVTLTPSRGKRSVEGREVWSGMAGQRPGSFAVRQTLPERFGPYPVLLVPSFSGSSSRKLHLSIHSSAFASRV